MKHFIALLILSFVPAIAAAPDAMSPAGVYHSVGGTQVFTLAILPNGNYPARWDIDISPEHGRASGTWHLVGDELRLRAKKEEGGLKGHLTVLFLREMEGQKALLRKEDAQHADNPFFYFYKRGGTNQPP